MPRSSSLTMQRYSLEPRTRKYVVGYKFLWFARNYKIQLLDTGLENLQKTASRKVVHKGSKFFGKKTLDPVTKSKDDNNVKTDKIPR